MKRRIPPLRRVLAALRPSAPAHSQATRGLTPGERYDRRQMLHNMARREQSLAALGDDYCLSLGRR